LFVLFDYLSFGFRRFFEGLVQKHTQNHLLITDVKI